MTINYICCKFCGVDMPDDAGAYYHRSDCEKRSIARRMEKETDPEKLKALEAEYERAAYVGD